MLSLIDNSIEVFLDKFGEEKEEIFQEIDYFLQKNNCSHQSDLIDCFKEKLSKMPIQYKKLKRNLFLKYDSLGKFIYLTDEKSSFKLIISFIKKIKVDDYENDGNETKYIISEQYYHDLFKEKIVKYKLKNSPKTNSMDSLDVRYIILNNK